jgi:hypothetical protein
MLCNRINGCSTVQDNHSTHETHLLGSCTHTHTAHTHTAYTHCIHTLHTHTAHTHTAHTYTHCTHTLHTHCTHTLHTYTHTAHIHTRKRVSAGPSNCSFVLLPSPQQSKVLEWGFYLQKGFIMNPV